MTAGSPGPTLHKVVLLLALGGNEGEYASAALREEIVTILIKLAIAAGLATALTSTALAADLVVGFSQIGSESGWRAAETSVTKLEAEKRGIDLKFADAQQKQENQIKAIRGFIAQGVDAAGETGHDGVAGVAEVVREQAGELLAGRRGVALLHPRTWRSPPGRARPAVARAGRGGGSRCRRSWITHSSWPIPAFLAKLTAGAARGLCR